MSNFFYKGEAAIAQSGTFNQITITLTFDVQEQVANMYLLPGLYRDAAFDGDAINVGARGAFEILKVNCFIRNFQLGMLT